MNNRAYVNDWIEVDRMDVDEDDERQLEEAEESKDVEDPMYPNWMKRQLMVMIEYSFD